MPRKPRTLKATNNPLLEAVQFVGSILKDAGTPNETHLLLSNGWCVASTGVLSSGIRVDTPFIAAPNYSLLQAALAKCGQDGAIGDNPFTVKSGKLKAIIPCIDPSILNILSPNAPITPVSNKFKEALEIVGVLANENGQTIHAASVLMNGQSVVATEGGRMIIEYWHGENLPPNLAIPKSFIVSLSKISKNLKQFGFSDNSVTIYFEDDSWIKTQLYNDHWPNIAKVLDKQSNPMPIPKTLYEGLNAIEAFATEGLVYFDSNILRSNNSDLVGSSYEVAGLPKGPIFNIKQLMIIKDLIKTVDFFVDGGKVTLWCGENCRGAIAGRTQ